MPKLICVTIVHNHSKRHSIAPIYTTQGGSAERFTLTLATHTDTHVTRNRAISLTHTQHPQWGGGGGSKRDMTEADYCSRTLQSLLSCKVHIYFALNMIIFGILCPVNRSEGRGAQVRAGCHHTDSRLCSQHRCPHRSAGSTKVCQRDYWSQLCYNF